MNRLPTETCIRSAMMINMMLGGIRMPSVPEAAITPVARAWLYLWRSIVGSASAVIMVTDAPMMPVMAARIVPMTVTDIARPPGTFRSSTWVV